MVQQRRSGRGFLFGLIVGLIAGAVLAILFAPQPGESTQATVGEQGLQLGKRGQDRYQLIVEQFRRRYGEALEQGHDAYDRAVSDVMTRYNRAKSGDFSAD